MWMKLKSLLLRYKEQLLYVFFGGLTTLINMAVYALCMQVFGWVNVPSVIIAWVLSVLFAFVTNKLWVFESRETDRATLLREGASFFGARAATGVLDVIIMYLAVDCLGWNATLWKLISNILVIILNYVASKLFIFNKKQSPRN